MSSLKPPPLNGAALNVPTAPAPLSPQPPPPPLSLTIRFSASIPDLDLEIPHPSQTTVVSLKHLIRGRLAEPNSQRRLRFIQGGRILPDTAALSAVLRAPPPAPPSRYDEYESLVSASSGPNGADGDATGKGKGKGKGKNIPNRPRRPSASTIGDSLTTAELESEAKAALSPPPTHLARGGPPTPNSGTGTTTTATNNNNQSRNTPRGFDRLLNAGFTPAEVNQLRLQFRSIHASRYTPDTLPSPDSFRRMEDSWIDDNGAAAMPTTASNTGGSGLDDEGAGNNGAGLAGHLDALVWGVVTGFMWPLGSFGWLVRQHGIHSDRWKFMVCVGVFFSFLIGIVRSISGGK
ncbi:DSC E3 ubiquitin ligase complex subunit 3 [Apiospora rasikravindrae]|uniref:DSC E3 ubiquitin ligase complex subunit 3 n=1 Tax=Apiospora rasikravindrae TaxID=990691 RepID=A0ABR1T005_9PEZI